MPPRRLSLKARALQWLAQREHSPQELRGKLLSLPVSAPEAGPADESHAGEFASAPPEAEVDALLAWLTERGYLSAGRFVESRVAARQTRFGNAKILHELAQHGLALDSPSRQALQASEADRAHAVWQRKFGCPAATAQQRAQQLRFLAGRGFSADVAYRVVPKVAPGADTPAGPEPQASDDA